MPDLLRSGAAWLGRKLGDFCSSQVTYTRGVDNHTIDAVFGQTRFEVEDQYGLRVELRMRDFLIAADVFPYAEPQPGDRVIADGRRYEVLSLGDEGCWRWSDPFRTLLRIHTKDVGPDD